MADVRVLIVDGEPEIRTLLRTTLEGYAYKMTCAENGHEALKIVHAKTPDIILLDLGLPDRDGQNVLTTIRETTKTPVIILSARDQEVS